MAHVAYTADTQKDNGIFAANQTGGDSVFGPASPADGTYAAPTGAVLGAKAHKKARHHKKRGHHRRHKRHKRHHHRSRR